MKYLLIIFMLLHTDASLPDIICMGRVTAVRPGPHRGPITEHDPDWQEAIIRVESWIKGVQANQDIVVRFPGSLDVAWYEAPKLKVGQEGTFFLRKDKITGLPKAILGNYEVDAYTALNAEDFRLK